MSILFKITYGLYMLSTNDNGKDSGCIVNTVMQQTAVPETLSITVNKENYTTGLIKKTKRCVVNVLAEDTPFEFFKNFGMQSSKDVDKFKDINCEITKSGIKTNKDHSAGYFEMEILNVIDMGTHLMFVGKIVDSKIYEGAKAPVTYDYYHKNIKPKPAPKKEENADKEIWECRICGYRHEGPVPDDFVCPWCKHGKDDMFRVK